MTDHTAVERSFTRRPLSSLSLYLNQPIVRTFRSAPTGAASLAIISILIVAAVIGDPVFGEKAKELDTLAANQGPSAGHLLGTDALGRDILARIMVSARLSLGLGLGAALLGLLMGSVFGAITAVLGRRLRPVAQRAIDTMLSFPAVLIAIFISTIIGAGAAGAMVGVAVAISFALARVTSTLALSIGGRDYVSAARVIGVSRRRLLARYVLPNIAEPLIIATSVAVSTAIVTVSALSFLGLGVQAPQSDWGLMLTDGVRAIYLTPIAALAPAAAIAISALAFGFTGEALARAMNPLLWAGRGGSDTLVGDVVDEPGKAVVKKLRRFARARARNEHARSLRHGERAVLEVKDLRVTLPGDSGPLPIVKGVSFSLPKGQIVGLVGESGSGKTMTAMAIAQLLPYPAQVGGTVELADEVLDELDREHLDRHLGAHLAVVFQDPMSSLNPALTIGRQLTEGPRHHRDLSGSVATQLAIDKLREVHIGAPERQIKRYPHEYSGGMRQRAMIAMGLMNDPTLLIADEPTTALDVTIQAQIMDLVHEVNQRHGTTVILISHNLALISQNCDRVLVMYAGLIVEDMHVAALVAGPKHPYARALLGAVPEVGETAETLAYIPGEPPDPALAPSGCPYHPRCPLAIDKCRAEMPPLLEERDARRLACWVESEVVD